MKNIEIPKKDAEELKSLMGRGLAVDCDMHSRLITSERQDKNVFGRENDDIHVGDGYTASAVFDDGVKAELTVEARLDPDAREIYLEAYITWYYANGEVMDESDRDSDGFLGEWGYDDEHEHPDYSVNVVAV